MDFFNKLGEKAPTVLREFKKYVVLPIIKELFDHDYFKNRIDNVLIFVKLSDSQLMELANKELNNLKILIEDTFDIKITWHNRVSSSMVKGFNIDYGARSIKNEIVRRLEWPLLTAFQNKPFKTWN